MMSNVRAWIGLIGLSLMASIAFIDFTIVYTSLPAIQLALNVPILTLQLVMSIFSLALSISMIFVGKLADQFGKRRLFFIGTVIFAIASLGAGFSTNFAMLIFFRFFQGFAASITFTSSSLLAPLSFKKEQQPLAISFYTTITGLGLTSGPFLGGIIVEYFGWQWIFFLNIPIVILGFILCLGNVKETKLQENVKHDVPGLFLFAAGLSLIIFFLSYSGTLGWTSPYVVGGLTLGIVLMIVLVFVEKKQPCPLLDIEDISNPKVKLAMLTCTAASVMTGILMLFIPLYLSSIVGFSSSIIGVLMLATPVMQVVVSILWPKLSKELGVARVIVLGILTCFIAAFFMIFFSPTTTIGLILPCLILMGVIWGVTNAACITLATTAVPEEKAGSAIGLIFTNWNVAGCILITLSSVIFSQVEFAKLESTIQAHHIQITENDHHRIAAAIASPEKASSMLKEISPSISDEVFPLFKQSFMSGFHAVMIFSTVLLFAFLCISIALIRRYKIE
jgi:EmrB/QacA subfamily drug resistance transporter